ncbi:HU family DNA-binding protein [Helicobacter felis]|uniref:DNA-binding protein HU homolog n=1 Tax=Helicobacter felis (strain ATCC 49179 / CCUG 28539 / NCTC 12436 / CS1) TaxID=936155 RepID=E7ABS1_HELFC|nr:HU family DNA-binding protein [Helicobacter felis]CBY82894.1 DNA-binding protein HU homolog [Helicobacter felis ATCC 49179]
MKKLEFIDLMQKEGGFKDKKDTELAFNSFIKAIEKALSQHESVELVGFGKFEAVLQKGKKGKVPGSDKTYTTKDKMVPKFKPGKILKDAVATPPKIGKKKK